MRIVFCSLLLAANVLPGLTPTPAGERPEAPSLERLIDQLGSRKYAERQAAARKLDALGEQAVPALKKASHSSDPEQRRRAEQLLDRIEQRLDAARLLAGKRIRLVCKDTPVLEAVKDLAARSSFAVEAFGDRATLTKRKITLDTGETTFWDALDQLCRKAGLSETPATLREMRDGSTGGIPEGYNDITSITYHRPNLGATAPIELLDLRSKAPPTHVAGGLRLRALAVPAQNGALIVDSGSVRTLPRPSAADLSAPAGNEIGFLLEASPEPALPWQGLTRICVHKAVDEHGQMLTQADPFLVSADDLRAFNSGQALVWDSATGAPAGPSPAARVAPVRFKPGKQPSTRLKEVHGTLTVQVQSMRQLAVVDNVLQRQRETVVGDGGVWVRVVEVERTGQQLRMAMLVQAPGPRGKGLVQVRRNERGVLVMDSNDAKLGIELELQDASGAALKPSDSRKFLTSHPRGMEMVLQYHLSFRLAPNQPEPTRLVCRGPRTVAIDVPFTLRDVPLCAALRQVPIMRANPYLR